MDPDMPSGELTRFVSERLAEVADSDVAAEMASYMYGRRFQAMNREAAGLPFWGVKKPARTPILKEACRQFPAESAHEYRSNVAALWALPHREERYLAIGYAIRFPKYIEGDSLALYERMVTDGGWWDFVDAIAVDLIGHVVRTDRDDMGDRLDCWIESETMWLRRTGLLSQLKHKSDTDARMLFDFCQRRAHETEFFIRKAIGWALREYSKTDRDAVKLFVDAHRSELSGLSIREATKHL